MKRTLKTEDADPMLFYCWITLCYAGRQLKLQDQHQGGVDPHSLPGLRPCACDCHIYRDFRCYCHTEIGVLVKLELGGLVKLELRLRRLWPNVALVPTKLRLPIDMLTLYYLEWTPWDETFSILSILKI